MNLHLVPDDKFIGRLIERIRSLPVGANNTFVVKNPPPFRHLQRFDLPGAYICKGDFQDSIGNIRDYAKVFIHFIDADAIEFINRNEFNKLYWMPWGADIYESLFTDFSLLDTETKKVTNRSIRSGLNHYIYFNWSKLIKYKKYKRAYAKIDYVCNWLPQEFEYAVKTLPGLRATHQLFNYDLDLPVSQLGNRQITTKGGGALKIMVGHSGVPSNNHAAALIALKNVKQPIDEVRIPVSYGSPVYVNNLKRYVKEQNFGFKVVFDDAYVPFEEYIGQIDSFDIIILNNWRPAGMGNFWLGAFLGKKLFLSKRNLISDFLKTQGWDFFYLDDLQNLELLKVDADKNRSILFDILNDKRINDLYANLFD